MKDSIVSPCFWFHEWNLCLSTVLLFWGLHISWNFHFRHLSGLRWTDDCSGVSWRLHLCCVNKRRLPLNGFCSCEIEVDICLCFSKLVWVRPLYEDVILLFKKSPIFSNIPVENERVGSAESLCHDLCAHEGSVESSGWDDGQKKEKNITGNSQVIDLWHLLTPCRMLCVGKWQVPDFK